VSGKSIEPGDWSQVVSLAELEAAQRGAIAAADELHRGTPPAPLPRVLEGPYVQIEDNGLPIALQLGLSPSGRLICTGLLVGWLEGAKGGGGELKPSEVHAIRLGQLLNDLDLSDEPIRDSTISPVPNWLRQNVPAVKHPGHAGHPDDHYERVAQLYTRALVERPGAPMQWLAEQLHVSPATAYRWRDEAADRGFLPKRTKVKRGATRARNQPKRKESR
jgi:hypothetical protein